MSVGGVSSSSGISSIYGNRNIISGLASGIDTESMIENAVSGYKQKISSLNQKSTKVTWQMEAYRSITDKMVNFSQKYTSYTSNTNLLSSSFFNNAVKTTTNGQYAGKVAASGKTTSDVQITGVAQLAKAASYRMSGDILMGSAGNSVPTISTQGEGINLGKDMDISNVSGSLTIRYGGTSGGRSFDLNFDELDAYKSLDEMKEAIEEKLGDIQVTDSSGTRMTAADMVKVTVNGNNIEFSDKRSNNSVTITGAGGKIADTMGIKTSDKDWQQNSANKLTLGEGQELFDTVKVGEYLTTGDKTINVTLDGITKKIKLPSSKEDGNEAVASDPQAFVKDLKDAFKKAFGDKITVSSNAEAADFDADNTAMTFTFQAKEGSTMSISGDYAEALGLGERSTSYVDTGKTLKDLLGEEKIDFLRDENAGDLIEVKEEDVKTVYKKDKDGKELVGEDGNKVVDYYKDKNGNRVKKFGDNWYQVDEEDALLHEFKMNGVSVGKFSENSALENIMTAINNNSEVGVNVSYSKTTNQFQFTATESGVGSQISMESNLAQRLFGKQMFNDDGTYAGMQAYDSATGKFENIDADSKKASYEAGQDAILSMRVNGQELNHIKRSNNSFDVDGLTVSLKGTFGYQEASDASEDGATVGSDGKAWKLDGSSEAVTFTSSSDSDKIVDAIKSMVEDYNEMITEIKNAYSTTPAQKSNGSRYEPLTEDDMEGMSDSAIKAYEEKAKQGILFADRDLSSLYNKLHSAITSSGNDGSYLRSIGISTGYSNGLTTISLDETKLRAALDTNPDKVKDAFTKSVENGSSTNGLMQSMKKALDAYAGTTGATKGILIEKAGSVRAPTTINNNTLQDKLNNYTEQIEKWQNKMADQIDRYTSKFTQLEQLIAQMNSQSSALSSFMGSSY